MEIIFECKRKSDFFDEITVTFVCNSTFPFMGGENVITFLFSPTSNPHTDMKDSLQNCFTTIFIKVISAKSIFKKNWYKVADISQETGGKKKNQKSFST